MDIVLRGLWEGPVSAEQHHETLCLWEDSVRRTENAFECRGIGNERIRGIQSGETDSKLLDLVERILRCGEDRFEVRESAVVTCQREGVGKLKS